MTRRGPPCPRPSCAGPFTCACPSPEPAGAAAGGGSDGGGGGAARLLPPRVLCSNALLRMLGGASRRTVTVDCDPSDGDAGSAADGGGRCRVIIQVWPGLSRASCREATKGLAGPRQPPFSSRQLSQTHTASAARPGPKCSGTARPRAAHVTGHRPPCLCARGGPPQDLPIALEARCRASECRPGAPRQPPHSGPGPAAGGGAPPEPAPPLGLVSPGAIEQSSSRPGGSQPSSRRLALVAVVAGG
jgi:hypothetical protein